MNGLEDLVFKNKDSDLYNSMHSGHRNVLKSFFVNNKPLFLKLFKENFPPKQDNLVWIFRCPEYKDRYKNDLPIKDKYPHSILGP